MKWNPERVSNIILFINKYKRKGINYLSKIDDQKTFEKNDFAIAHNILYIKEKKYVRLILQKLIRIAKNR